MVWCGAGNSVEKISIVLNVYLSGVTECHVVCFRVVSLQIVLCMLCSGIIRVVRFVFGSDLNKNEEHDCSCVRVQVRTYF